jgi:hypothetical protein
MQARASLLLCSLEIISLIIVINTNVICWIRVYRLEIYVCSGHTLFEKYICFA